MPNKRMLFLQITKDYENAYRLIKEVASIYKLDVDRYEFTDTEKMSEFLGSVSVPYDYIYVGAHGNENGIGTNSSEGSHFIRWADFAMEICASPGLTNNSVLYLGCCYGGVRRGALILFALCDTVHHVCGSQCSIDEYEAVLAFHTYIFHHQKGIESETINKIVATSINRGFDVYSRYNMDAEIGQIQQLLNAGGCLPDHYYTSEELDVMEQEYMEQQAGVSAAASSSAA